MNGLPDLLAKPSIRPQQRRGQNGWSLLEMILGLGLMALVLGAGVSLQARVSDRQRGQLKADAVSNVTQLAAQYFLAHRQALEARMSGSNSDAPNPCQINVLQTTGVGVAAFDTVKHTCAIDTSLLLSLGLWPSGVPIDNGVERWVAIFRQVYWAGQATGADEVLVLSAALQNGQILQQGEVTFKAQESSFLEQMQASLSILGGAGGFVPPGHDLGSCQFNSLVKQVCGNAWAVTLSDFL
jgi:type II secretory pathway pseudopilin PulG